MATGPMVVAVRRNVQGDVVEVRRGIADTQANAWSPNGAPRNVPIIEIVDAIMGGNSVWSRMPSGAPGPSSANQELAAQVAAVPLAIRGYGHVKLASLALARAREAELMHRLLPNRYPRPPAGAKAGQLRGIAITTAR